MKIIFVKYKTLYFLIISIILAIALCLTVFIFKNKTMEMFNTDDVFYKGNIDKQVIGFTCNVDWGNEYIPLMLKILKEGNIKITFFVTGRWAEKNQELLKEIYNEGHEIGNHGYKHRDYSILNYEQNKDEILKAHQVIVETIGVKPTLFAPPAGSFNKETIKAASDLGYKVIMWSIDTIDWHKDSTKDKIIQRVITKPHNSAIVLMHPKEETIKALPVIIKLLSEEGYKIGKISDIVK